MKDFPSLKPILVVAVLLALVALLIWVAVQQDFSSWIIPPPEKTAESLVGALGAHRYSGAMETLSQNLSSSISQEDLVALVQSIESSQDGIQDAHGVSAQEQGNTASAAVKVKLGNNQEITITLPLVKENGLWKVNSIAPLHGLAGARGHAGPRGQAGAWKETRRTVVSTALNIR